MPGKSYYLLRSMARKAWNLTKGGWYSESTYSNGNMTSFRQTGDYVVSGDANGNGSVVGNFGEGEFGGFSVGSGEGFLMKLGPVTEERLDEQKMLASATAKEADDENGLSIVEQTNIMALETSLEMMQVAAVSALWELGIGFVTSRVGTWLAATRLGKSALVALGRGSTGRTVATSISERWAMKFIKDNPRIGEVIIEKIGDPRWSGWSKMQYIHRPVDGGRTVTVHYVAKFENGILKFVDDFKFK